MTHNEARLAAAIHKLLPLAEHKCRVLYDAANKDELVVDEYLRADHAIRYAYHTLNNLTEGKQDD